MAKTQEELNQPKEEYEVFTTKPQQLTEDELKSVTGGINKQYITFYVGLKVVFVDVIFKLEIILSAMNLVLVKD